MSLDTSLDIYLAGIEAGKTTVEECTTQSPELAPLLQLAIQLRSMPAPAPSPQFVQDTRDRLMCLPVPTNAKITPQIRRVNLAAQHPIQLRNLLQHWSCSIPALTRRWQPALVGLFTAIIAILILGGGTVLASADVAPTSPLYPIKRIVERSQLFLATSPEHQALLHTEFAKRRLNEAVQIAALGWDDKAEGLVKEYDYELKAAVSIVEQVAAQGESVAQLSDQLLGKVEAQRTRVEQARSALPNHVVDSALAAVSQAGERLDDLDSQQSQTSVSAAAMNNTPVPGNTSLPIVPIGTPKSFVDLTIKNQQSTTVPFRSTVAPVPLLTTSPSRSTPVIVVFSSPSPPQITPKPIATATQPSESNKPRSATPSLSPDATRTRPSDTNTPEPTNTPRPATPTVVPSNTKTPIVPPTPRPFTPTVVQIATQKPTIVPTPGSTISTHPSTEFPPSESSSLDL